MGGRLESKKDCTNCKLWTKGRSKVVWGEGFYDAPILLIGEAPGEKEDMVGLPFVGLAGQELKHQLMMGGVNLDACAFTNVLKCRPPGNRDPEPDEVEACGAHLLRQLKRSKAKYIGLLGRFASRFILGDVNMEEANGKAYELEDQPGRWFMPIFHPAAGMHSHELMIQVFAGIGSFVDMVKGREFKKWEPDPFDGVEHYHICKTCEDVDRLVGSATEIAIDTETDGGLKGNPWCLSFSAEAGTGGMVLAENEQVVQYVGEIARDPDHLTILHNALFDVPVLGKMGVELGDFADTMLMAYLLQDEPQGLKPLAVKHFNMNMEDYEGMVEESADRKALAYLAEVVEREWPAPPPEVYFKNGEPTIRQSQGLDKRVGGILYDQWFKGSNPRARWYKIKPHEGRRMVEQELGEMPEGSLADIDIETAKWYACRDADATIRVYSKLWPRITAAGLDGTMWRDIAMMPMVVDMMKTGMKIDRDHFPRLVRKFEGRKRAIMMELIRYTKGGKPINPNSPPQVGELLFKRLGIKHPSGPGSTSTAGAILTRLLPEHPAVGLIQDWRSYDTLISKFAAILPDLAGADDRIHTTLRTTRVDTGRLSSSEPNLMAQPTRSEDGRLIRDGFVAEEGCTILSMDYSQVEMRYVASESEDAKMCHIFRENVDIHSQTAADMFKVPFEEVDELTQRYPAKRVGFGILNDLSPEGLQRTLIEGGAKESDWPVEACEELIQRWFGVYSGVAQYMLNNHTRARRYGYVWDMWGRRRLVPGVRSALRWLVTKALRQAGNAPIQMGAQGIIKEAMGRLVPVYRAIQELGYVCNPLIQIHDDLVWEVSDEAVPYVAGTFPRIMEGCVELAVPLEVEPKAGKRWGSLLKMDKYYDKYGGGGHYPADLMKLPLAEMTDGAIQL